MRRYRNMTGLWLLSACLAVSAAIAQERPAQIIVTTDPAGATVSLDGIVKSASPLTISGVSTGEHLVAASMMGYLEARRTVTLTPDQNLPVALKLDPVCGLVLIHSEPSGADVQINGADRGKTPLLITDIALGKYRVKVSLMGYLSKEVDLSVKSRTPQKVSVPLGSDSAKLDLDSEPTGAKVTVNGVAKGVTPCVLDKIPAGSTTLELTMEGFLPFKQALKLSPGQSERISATLTLLPAELTIVSIPPKARIYVNNEFKGESPVTLKDVPPGTVRLRAELKGHEPNARTITLEKNQKTVEEFRLERNCGTMELTTEPADVKVFVDGEEAGSTVAKKEETDRISEPFVVDLLSIGEHQVQLSRKGCKSKSFTVNIERDKTVSRHEKMEERFVPNCEVRTARGVFQGVLREVDPLGNVKIEVKPGVLMTIQARDVRSRKTLREEPEPEEPKPDKKGEKKDEKKETVKEPAN